MAATLPDSEFVGVDLASDPIARGCEVVGAIGLKNIRLLALDLMDFDGAMGEFDYIVAHGLYAWVPEPVRDKILAIAASHLSSQGVAFVSYNANPAGRLRQAMREMMLFHAGEIDDPATRVEQGKALLQFVAGSRNEPDVWLQLMQHQVASLGKRSAEVVYHDEFAGVYEPVYFHQFAAHAARHGLQYLSDALFGEMNAAFALPEAQKQLRELSGGDVLRYEQYLDFLKFRKFRQTLLCHSGIALDRSLAPERLRELYVSSSAVRAPGPPDAAPDVETFERPNGPSASTNNPTVKAILNRLIGLWPQSERLEDLHTLAEERVVAEILLKLYGATLVEFHAYRSPVAGKPGLRPEASPLARYQAREHTMVTTLRHSQVEIPDSLSRQVLQLLDGTRDREALLDELAIHAFGTPRETLEAQLEGSLAELTRLGLLIERQE
jgi:methyltransferase-like protein